MFALNTCIILVMKYYCYLFCDLVLLSHSNVLSHKSRYLIFCSSIFIYQISIFNFQFLIHCLWYNERPYANVTFKNLPFKIGFNLLGGRPVAWIYPYSLINLTLKAKRMFIHIWNLVNCRNYLSYSQVRNTTGKFL